MSIDCRLSATLLLVASLLAPTCATSADDDELALTPRQQAIADRLDPLISARRKSGDFRLRILYSMSAEIERRPDDNGLYGKELITSAELYEQARGSTDPVALDLLIRRCGYRTKTEDRCDRVALARRWAEVDAQNVVAWLALSGALHDRGRTDDARAAFHSATRAAQWHDHFNDVARLVARSIPNDFTAPERGAALMEALMKAHLASPIETIQVVNVNCKRIEARDDCARLVETMSRDADTVLVVSMTPRMAQRAGVPADRLAFYQQKADAAQWSSRRMHESASPFSDEDGLSAVRHVAWLQSLIDDGELKRVDRARMEVGVTEAEAASRYVATMSRDQLRNREQVRSENR